MIPFMPDYNQFDDIIATASLTYNVPIPWIKAVIGRESTFRVNPPVRIADKSYGLMQVTPKTAKGMGYAGTEAQLVDPYININLGTKLLHQLILSYGLDFCRVYSAYNSGRPDLYKTSTEVSKNVKGAVEWLVKFSAAEDAIWLKSLNLAKAT